MLKLLSKKILHSGWRKIVEKTFFDKNTQKEISFETKEECNVASALALTPENKVIVLEQFRHGPEINLFELPGGMIDTGEEPNEEIKRELLEETGYQGKIFPTGKSYICAYSNRVKYHFVAISCVKTQEPAHDETEYGTIHLYDIEKYKKEILKKGLLTDGETAYRGLEFLER